MTNSIYKYVAASHLHQVLGSNHATLKCSRPKDFNDPYELFLTVDFREGPDALAFYADVVGELPQSPTTCFSRSPAVIPMWAHYSESLSGFAIELDEEMLTQSFPKSAFGSMDYRDTPDEALTQMLYRAYELGKPRYLYLLRQGIRSAAYFTKASCWTYEQERRMIVGDGETRQAGELTLMDVPKECVTALICGPRASNETARALREAAARFGCRYLELRVGRSSVVPFFVDSEGGVFTFNNTAIAQSKELCSSCREPLLPNSELCSWCRIGDSHKHEAAARNTFRMLDHLGLLEGYVADMDDISRGSRKPDRA